MAGGEERVQALQVEQRVVGEGLRRRRRRAEGRGRGRSGRGRRRRPAEETATKKKNSFRNSVE